MKDQRFDKLPDGRIRFVDTIICIRGWEHAPNELAVVRFEPSKIDILKLVPTILNTYKENDPLSLSLKPYFDFVRERKNSTNKSLIITYSYTGNKRDAVAVIGARFGETASMDIEVLGALHASDANGLYDMLSVRVEE